MASVYGAREEDVTDAEWLEEAGRRGWVVLTKDERIRRRPMEIEALRRAGARVFCIVNANLRAEEQVARFLANLNRITQASMHPGPYVCAVHKTSVKRIWP